MKRKVSEFSYGFVLTHELVNVYGHLPTDSPETEKSVESEVGAGERDAARRGFPLFLQFKASEYMKRKNAGESKLVGLPYFRFPLYRKSQSNLHQLLIELERKGNSVFYATPKIHEAINLNEAFFEKQVVARSLFINPVEIGELPDKESHRIVFSAFSDAVYLCSAPRRLDGVIHGDSFADSLRRSLSGREPDRLDGEFFRWLAGEMLSLVSPNRRIFDEFSRGISEMKPSIFANYLAKTLFDCELLIIPAET